METEDYREILLNEFQIRRTKNAAYSLRAFAREIGILPSRLSEVLSRKQGLSEKRAEVIAEALKLPADVKSLFLDLVASQHARNQVSKDFAIQRLAARKKHPHVILTEEQFESISDWYYFAILEMVVQYPEKSKISRVAQELNLTPEVVNMALGRLTQLGLIYESSEGNLTRLHPQLKTTHDKPSRAIQAYHKQILQKATESLTSTQVHERDYSSINFWITSEEIVKLKEQLMNLRRQTLSHHTQPSPQSRLYALNLQLFPLQRLDST